MDASPAAPLHTALPRLPPRIPTHFECKSHNDLMLQSNAKPRSRKLLQHTHRKISLYRGPQSLHKEKFLMFTRILLKYLEQKDIALHGHVKQIVKDCTVKHLGKVQGYESITLAMSRRLKDVVIECYWKRTEAFLDHYLKEKEKAGSKLAAHLLTAHLE